MAEAILKKVVGDHFEIYSAGFEAKEIDPLAINVLEEKGYDTSGQYSKNLEQYLGKVHFGIVITVCKKAEEVCPTIPGVGTRLYWPIDDPAEVQTSEEDRLKAFREARDQIETKIKNWLKERNIKFYFFNLLSSYQGFL